jgi:cell wall-associated NlpC family hydrolase
MDREVFAFEPGPTARPAGALTRLRRSLASPQVAVAGSYQFNPDLNVHVAGPWTRLRRSGAELDLPRLPPRAVPVTAAALLGAVAMTSLLARGRSSAPGASEATPVVEAPRAPAPRIDPVPRELAPARVEATLKGERAVLPAGAPPILKRVVAAANRIADRPYLYGGGHGSFESSGYDCSGAVSYALHGGGLLEAPLASGSLAGWGEPGEGKAITVYANGGHVFAVIAGLRWDTSGTGSTGPSWHRELRSTAGYTARHPAGY